VASERQIAANRRNADKSTGPKSDSGKKRASRNAYRHGLSMPLSALETGAQLRELARQFAGETPDREVRALAERAADAELDLARIRRVRTAMIERAQKQGESLATALLPCEVESLSRSETVRPSAPASGEGEEGRANYARNILGDLVKIYRYENRAIGRRDRAIRQMAVAESPTTTSLPARPSRTGAT
jgi:hypothetical protein